MITAGIRTNRAAFEKTLTDFQRKQLPFATATALNLIATGVKADIVESMKTDFDQPVAFTLNAFYLYLATKSRQRAVVAVRDFAGKGTPAWKYLDPEVEGGPRRQKRFERRLQAVGQGLPFAVPGKGAQLDSHGNMSRGQIGQILSALGALGATGQNISAASSKRRRRKGMLVHQTSPGRRSDYFVATSKATGKPIGVYQLVGKGRVEPVLLFSDKAPTYRPRWPVSDVVLKSIDLHGRTAFAKAWSYALETAR